jgi:hypothetical protein
MCSPMIFLGVRFAHHFKFLCCNVFFFLSLSSPVSVALDCLFLIALSIYSNVYCHSHFIPPFLSLSVSPLDCLFSIALSIFSNVHFHSHFFPPFLSSLVSTLDCLYLITLSIIFDVYCHSHFIPPCLSFSCQLWIVYSWLHFRLSLTSIAIAISSPLFYKANFHVRQLIE